MNKLFVLLGSRVAEMKSLIRLNRQLLEQGPTSRQHLLSSFRALKQAEKKRIVQENTIFEFTKSISALDSSVTGCLYQESLGLMSQLDASFLCPSPSAPCLHDCIQLYLLFFNKIDLRSQLSELQEYQRNHINSTSFFLVQLKMLVQVCRRIQGNLVKELDKTMLTHGIFKDNRTTYIIKSVNDRNKLDRGGKEGRNEWKTERLGREGRTERIGREGKTERLGREGTSEGRLDKVDRTDRMYRIMRVDKSIGVDRPERSERIDRTAPCRQRVGRREMLMQCMSVYSVEPELDLRALCVDMMGKTQHQLLTSLQKRNWYLRHRP